MREPVLNAAPVVPDLEAIRGFLRSWCGPGVALDGLEVSYFQVDEEGISRLLCEGPGPDGETLRVAARRLAPEKASAVQAEINGHSGQHDRADAAAAFLEPARYAADLGLLFQVFPADRRLPALPSALDRERMAAVLESALAGRTNGGRVTHVDRCVMRYKPEQKCLIRYEIAWSGPRPGPAVVYGRISSAKTFGRTTAVLRQVRETMSDLRFEVPEPLAVVPALGLELFSELPGVILFALTASDAFPGLCRATGQALAQFHSLPVGLEREWTRDATLRRLSDGTATVARLFSAHATRVEELRRRIERRFRGKPSSPWRLIHHDFHGDNVLVHGGRLGLLDFEDCAVGDPADDVGSNWAQLTWHSLKRPGSAAEAGRRAFLQAYLATAAERDIESLTSHAALHCLLYASQCLRHPRDAARHADAEAMLAAGERVLDQGLR